MKTFLYAAGALIIATSAAQAASAASERAGGVTAPTAQGERIPSNNSDYFGGRDLAPVMLQRDMGFQSPAPATNTGAVFRSWTGNDNEG